VSLAGPLIGLAATLAAAVTAAAAAIRQAGRARRRNLYSDAYRAAMAWREMVYRVRRRAAGQEPELIAHFHAIQEQIHYHEGWISTESLALAGSYCNLVKTVRDICAAPIQDAWKAALRDFASQTEPTDVHPDVASAANAFLRDAREHLSPWPWIQWRVDRRNLPLTESTWGLRAWTWLVSRFTETEEGGSGRGT